MKQICEIYKMKAGLKYSMERNRHLELEENPDLLTTCEGHIVGREYFLQLCPVIATFIILFLGYTKFYQIFGVNIVVAILSAVLCRMLPLYKIPLFSVISIFWGMLILRFFVHFIIIGILSFTIFKNGWIFMYYIISELISDPISALLTGYHQMLKQNNEIADYVLGRKV